MNSQLTELDESEKLGLLSIAVTSFSQEFCEQHNGRFAILGELPDFFNTFAASSNRIVEIIYKKNVGVEVELAIADSIARYPNFLVDLEKAMELERIPRDKRPDRDVT